MYMQRAKAVSMQTCSETVASPSAPGVAELGLTLRRIGALLGMAAVVERLDMVLR